MKKNGRDKLLERAGELGKITANTASPSRKSSKPVAQTRKRVFPIPGLPIVKILDMRAVLK